MQATELGPTFAKALKAVREMNDLSMRAMADRLGTSAAGIKHWESGDVSPTLRKVTEIAQAMNVPVDIFVNDVALEGFLSASHLTVR